MLAYRSGTALAQSAGLTVTLPSGWQPNDIFILLIETNTGEAVPTPAGWTPFSFSPQIATDTRLTSFWRRAVAGDTAPVFADPGDHICALLLAFSGAVTTGDPFAAHGSAVLNNVAAFNVPTVNVPAAGHGLINIIGFGNDSTSDPIPTIVRPNTDPETLSAPGAFTNTVGGGGSKLWFSHATAAGNQTSSGSLGNHKNVISLVLIPEPDENTYVYNEQMSTVEVTEPTTSTLVYTIQLTTVEAPALNNPAPPNRRRGSMSFVP